MKLIGNAEAALGSRSANTLDHMSTIGVNHGITSHFAARKALALEGNASRLVKLSSAPSS